MQLLSSVYSSTLKIKAAHFSGMLITHLVNYTVSYPTAVDCHSFYSTAVIFCLYALRVFLK